MEWYCKNPLLTAKDINENIQDNLVLTHIKDNIYTQNGEYYTYTKRGIRKHKMSQYNNHYNIFSYRYNGVNRKFKVKTIYTDELTNIIQF